MSCIQFDSSMIYNILKYQNFFFYKIYIFWLEIIAFLIIKWNY